MDSFESIVQTLKKNAGASYGFAAYDGSGSPVGIIADKKKKGAALKGKAEKKGKLTAFGSVSISEDGKTCTFSCDKITSSFKDAALKPYFSKLTVAPSVIKSSAAPQDGLDDNEAVEDDAEEAENLDDTLVTLWSKSFATSLISAGVNEQIVGQYNGLATPVELKLPKFFISALKTHNAEAFAARMTDAANTLFDAELTNMRKRITTAQENPELTVDLNQFVVAFGAKAEKVVEVAWDKFINRYEVTKGFKKKRFRAIAVPVIGGAAAVVGTGTSIASGNVAGAVAGTIAALRATAALVTVWKQYYRDLEKVLKSMEGAIKRLADTYNDHEPTIREHAREGTLVTLNAISGGGLAKTFSSVKDVIDVFKPRLALAERKLDELMKQANTLIAVNTKEIASVITYKKAVQQNSVINAGDKRTILAEVDKLIANSDSAGQVVTQLLDKIADGNKRYQDMGTRVGKLEQTIALLNKGTAMTMEQIEKVMAFVANFVSTAANLTVGISTASAALDVVLTTIGGLADTHDYIGSEIDALEATVL